MTEDQVRQQKALLLLEHQEASTELAHLQEKAKRLSDSLNAVAFWVKRVSEGYMSAEVVYIADLGGEVNIVTDPRFVAALNFDKARELVAQIISTSERCRDLQERKEKLGLR